MGIDLGPGVARVENAAHIRSAAKNPHRKKGALYPLSASLGASRAAAAPRV